MSDRAYNAILDARPETVWPCVIEKTDFKQVLKFFRLIDDAELDDAEKYYYMLRIFFHKPPKDEPEAVTEEPAEVKEEVKPEEPKAEAEAKPEEKE